MATIDLALLAGSGGHPANSYTTVPYLVSTNIDFATAATTKGSALAQADVIQALDIPANTLVLSAGMQMITAITGTTADATIDFGITGGDVDAFGNGFDIVAAAADDYSVTPVATGPIVVGTADTLDMLIITQTGTLLTGVVRCWAVLQEIAAPVRPGRAALQS